MKRKVFYIFLVTLSLVTVSSCKKANDKGTPDITDRDGNVYTSVTIGTQEWMVENLKVTKLNDGSEITNITNQGSWSSANIAGYSWYDNTEADNKPLYGALYNLKAVQTGKLCPAGWHVPSLAEWLSLATFLGGESVAGSSLKEEGLSHWSSNNEDATNSTGFTGLPGGGRGTEGNFRGKGISGSWWSSTVYSGIYPYGAMVGLYYSDTYLDHSVIYNTAGASVRCLKN